MKNYFYNHQIKNYLTVFGDMFNNMKIVDTNDIGTYEKMVPISFTPKDKLHTILNPNNNIKSEASVEMNVPRMAMYLNSIDIATERQLNQYYRRGAVRCSGNSYIESEPIPYNLDIGLSIFTRRMDHHTQILENILPWFAPSQYIRMKEYSRNDSFKEVKVTLNSVSPNHNTEIGESERRIVQAELSFSIEGYIYRPIGSPSKQIYNSYVNIDAGGAQEIIQSSAIYDENGDLSVIAKIIGDSCVTWDDYLAQGLTWDDMLSQENIWDQCQQSCSDLEMELLGNTWDYMLDNGFTWTDFVEKNFVWDLLGKNE